MFRMGVSAAGFAKGYAAVFGMLTGIGTLFPLFFLHSAEIMSARGILTGIGLVITLTITGICGYVWKNTEREPGVLTGDITRLSPFSFKTGLSEILVKSSLYNVISSAP